MKVKLVEKESGTVLIVEEAAEFTPELAVIDCGKAGRVSKPAPDGAEWQAAEDGEVTEYAAANGVTFGEAKEGGGTAESGEKPEEEEKSTAKKSKK